MEHSTPQPPNVPRCLHILVRRTGGGTETNINRLCENVPEFDVIALEDLLGPALSPSKIPHALRELRRIGTDYRVVFCYGITSHALAMMAWPVGKKLVGNIRCETDFTGWKGIWKACFGWRFSEWISNSRMALYGGRGVVVYNGLPNPAPETALFPNLPFPVMGILASGHPKKGHRFALALWKKLGKPGSLIFAGNLPDNLKKMAEAEGVHCPGFVVAGPFLRSLDLLLIPSRAEGLPTVILEAMIRGIPVLATPVGGIPEVIRHGDNGMLLQRKHWGKALKKLDRNTLLSMGRTGREDALRRFRFDKMRDGFIEVAQRVLGIGR